MDKITVKFSKVLGYAGYESWQLDAPTPYNIIPFKSKKELMEYYGIEKAAVVGETFAITSRGNKRIYKIYEGAARRTPPLQKDRFK